MTQRQISHPEGLLAYADGHSARHILDLLGVDLGGGHLVECTGLALAEWRHIRRLARSGRKVMPAIAAPAADKVVQLDFGIAPPAPPRRPAIGGAHGRR